jgi:(S)-mandelate dehydrogenase
MTRRYQDAHCIEDFRELARRAMPRMVFDFIDGGAGTESTLRENRNAFDRIRLVGSAPVNVAARSLATQLFGKSWAMPVIIGPTGLAGAAWPKADLCLARAAAEAGIPFVMSTAATAKMEDVAAAAQGNAWFQLYLFRDRTLSARLLDRARDLRFQAIEVTVDNAIPGRRLRDDRNGFSLPLRWTPRKIAGLLRTPGWTWRTARAGAPRLELMAGELGLKATHTIAETMQAQLDPSLQWEDIRWVRDRWPGKLVVKGLLDPAQARRAMEIGADAVVISNHGGRQLDGAVAPIDMLPEFADATRGRLPLLVDSGFRTGSDIARALALGATAVQIGRPTLYAVASGGEPAVTRALNILRQELDVCYCLMGAARTDAIHQGMVRRTGGHAVPVQAREEQELA